MSDSAPPLQTQSRPEPLTPDMIQFRNELAAAYARHPALDTLPIGQARTICEAVRRPWADGGPVMHDSRDLQLDHAGMTLRLRVHQPKPVTDGVLAYVHGGGWTLFSLDTHDRVMREYAAAAQVTVVGLDYTLVPEAIFPRQLDEVTASLRLLRQPGTAEALGFDCSALPLAVAGDSAGGNLAMAAALALRDGGAADSLQAVILNYAVVGPGGSGASYRLYDGAHFNLTQDEMRGFWNGYIPSSANRTDPRAALLRNPLQDLPPTYLAIAECDVLRDENVALAEALEAAGVETKARIYEGMLHSFLEAVSISPTSRLAFEETAAWLRGIFGRPRPARPAG